MTPEQRNQRRILFVILMIGFASLVIALGAVDWRLGLGVGGALLILATSPWRDLR